MRLVLAWPPALTLTRVPRFWLFAVAAAVQIGLLTAMVIDRVSLLRRGTEVTLQTLPVDPRDLLRGDYVRLCYPITQVPESSIIGEQPDRSHPTIYVKLARGADGVHSIVSAHSKPVAVADGEVLLRGQTRDWILGCAATGAPSHRVAYGLEKNFVPQGEGRAIELAQVRTGPDRRSRVTVVAAVAPDGRAAIKRLLIDGQVLYAEPPY